MGAPMLAPAWSRSVVPLAAAELRQRFAGSRLGGLWALVQPLVEVAAFALLFGALLGPARGDGLGYALLVASGLLPWGSLREGLEGASGTLLENRWIRRSRVPVELLVARLVLAAGVRAAAGVVLVVLFAALRGRPAPAAAWALPFLALALQLAAVFGLGLALAPLAALWRDLRPALASLLTLLTFASPILYPDAALPHGLRSAIEWNPFTHLLRLYRAPLEPGEPVTLATALGVSAATAALAVLAGRRVLAGVAGEARDRL